MYSDIRALTGDSERSGLNIPILKNIQVPLPPLEVQKEIVAEIEGYQKVIDGARAVLDNYRPHIPIHPDWPVLELGEICEAILTGPFGSSLHQSDYIANGIPVINPQNIVDGAIIKDDKKTVSTKTRARLKEFTVRENDIIIARRGEMGRCAVDGWVPLRHGLLCYKAAAEVRCPICLFSARLAKGQSTSGRTGCWCHDDEFKSRDTIHHSNPTSSP
jgi:restriction endonuclease S subunit